MEKASKIERKQNGTLKSKKSRRFTFHPVSNVLQALAVEEAGIPDILDGDGTAKETVFRTSERTSDLNIKKDVKVSETKIEVRVEEKANVVRIFGVVFVPV